MKLKQYLNHKINALKCKIGLHEWEPEVSLIVDKHAESWDNQFKKIERCKSCRITRNEQ